MVYDHATVILHTNTHYSETLVILLLCKHLMCLHYMKVMREVTDGSWDIRASICGHDFIGNQQQHSQNVTKPLPSLLLIVL